MVARSINGHQVDLIITFTQANSIEVEITFLIRNNRLGGLAINKQIDLGSNFTLSIDGYAGLVDERRQRLDRRSGNLRIYHEVGINHLLIARFILSIDG